MTDERLYRLFKLHEIDEALLTIKNKAEHLDLGKREAAAIKKIQADYAQDLTRYDEVKKALAAEKSKAEQASEKIKKFSKQLYDGSVFSSKEVENLQKEIAMLEEIGFQAETRVEEFEAAQKPLGAKVAKIHAKIAELEKSIADKRKQAEGDHSALKERFKEIGAKRAEREAEVEPDLLKVYEAARKRNGTTGLALVSADGQCSGCGVPVPQRTKDAIRLGKTQQCESCRRVLFFREEAPA